MQFGSNGAINRAAAAGLGVSLQASAAAALELELGMLATISVSEDLPSRQWFAVRPVSGPREPARQFLEFVEGEAARQALERADPEASLARRG